MKFIIIILSFSLLLGCSDKPRPCFERLELGTFISQEKSGGDYKLITDKGIFYIWKNLNGMQKGDKMWLQDRRLRDDGKCYGVKNQIHLCTDKLNQCYWTH